MHTQFLTVVSGIITKMAKKRQQLQTWWKMESMNVKFLNMKFNYQWNVSWREWTTLTRWTEKQRPDREGM
jgi:hypothetical protein